MATMKNNAELMSKPLEITTDQYYWETFKPFLDKVMAECKTDEELFRTVDKVMNACNSLCQRKEYDAMAEEVIVLNRAISDKSYFYGVMKRAPEEEKALVRELQDKINTLNMIIKCEPVVEREENKPKDRIGYRQGVTPDAGENTDYITRNMKTLNEPMPKQRIPNV